MYNTTEFTNTVKTTNVKYIVNPPATSDLNVGTSFKISSQHAQQQYHVRSMVESL